MYYCKTKEYYRKVFNNGNQRNKIPITAVGNPKSLQPQTQKQYAVMSVSSGQNSEFTNQPGKELLQMPRLRKVGRCDTVCAGL